MKPDLSLNLFFFVSAGVTVMSELTELADSCGLLVKADLRRLSSKYANCGQVCKLAV